MMYLERCFELILDEADPVFEYWGVFQLVLVCVLKGVLQFRVQELVSCPAGLMAEVPHQQVHTHLVLFNELIPDLLEFEI